MDTFSILQRSSELIGLVPEVISLYSDIKQNNELDDAKSLIVIVDFARSKYDVFEKYCAPNEVLMLVCGILGMIHEGDSSELYLKLLNSQEV